MRDAPDREQQLRRLRSTRLPVQGGEQNGRSYSKQAVRRNFSERFCSIGERRGGTSHLEGVVLEQVGDTGLRLVATSGFYDDGDGRGWLSVVDGRDADPARIDHSRKTAMGDGPGHTRPCTRQHYFGNFVSTLRSGTKQSWPLSYHLGARSSEAFEITSNTCMRYARSFSVFSYFLGTEQRAPTNRNRVQLQVNRAEELMSQMIFYAS